MRSKQQLNGKDLKIYHLLQILAIYIRLRQLALAPEEVLHNIVVPKMKLWNANHLRSRVVQAKHSRTFAVVLVTSQAELIR